MTNTIKFILLGIMIALLIILAPSPALMEEEDLTFLLEPIPLDAKGGYMPSDACYLSDHEYKDASIHVRIENDRYLDTDIWIAHIKLAHPSQLRATFAGKFGSQILRPVHTMAKRTNAVFAINADYHSFSSNGVVVRNGRLYRNHPSADYDSLLIDDKGDLYPLINPTRESFEELYNALGGPAQKGGHVVHVFTFGPMLVADGQPAHAEFRRYNTGDQKYTQRMAIAQDGPLSYLCVTCEGPESRDSRGLTIDELAAYMLTLNCQMAYNLDGGSSATMVFQGKKINSIESHRVRPVADAIYFATAVAP